MAQPLISDDYDWFTPADLTRVINAIHALPDWSSVVLVGGQSLTAWVEYYKIKLPSFEGPYLTIDADFLGTRTEAEVIARELGSRPRFQPLMIKHRMPRRLTLQARAERNCTSIS